MKILHVNYFDIFGGAAKAAYRLHKALISAGINSQMLVQEKYYDDEEVIGPNFFEKYYGKIRFHYDRIKLRKFNSDLVSFYSPSGSPFSYIPHKIKKINPDIVHLHWFQGNMMRIEDLLKINKPLIWTVHDMWAITGGCFCSLGCTNYKNSCGKCYLLNSNKRNDLSFKLYKRKINVYNNRNITMASPSKWLFKELKGMNIFNRVVNIPNIINFENFTPYSIKEDAKRYYQIPQRKKCILFVSMNIKDKNKGFNLLEKALEKIEEEIIVMIVGDGEVKLKEMKGLQFKRIGFIKNEEELNNLYNAADITVVPSIQENFSNVIIESMLSGTPVVAFNVGGNPDLIEHKINGYLAEPYSISDLSLGIKWLLFSENLQKISALGREDILKKFNKQKILSEYINLYKSVLKKT